MGFGTPFPGWFPFVPFNMIYGPTKKGSRKKKQDQQTIRSAPTGALKRFPRPIRFVSSLGAGQPRRSAPPAGSSAADPSTSESAKGGGWSGGGNRQQYTLGFTWWYGGSPPSWVRLPPLKPVQTTNKTMVEDCHHMKLGSLPFF